MPPIPRTVEREQGHGLSPMTMPGIPVDPAEDVPEVSWPASVAVFDKMRRSDAQTAAVYRAIMLSAATRSWHLDPRGCSDAVVAFVADNTDLPILGVDEDDQPARARLRDRFSFYEHRRLALLNLIYGHMPFEQVYRITDDARTPTGVAAHLRKLAPRMPATLAAIDVAHDGGLDGIRQHPPGFDPARRGVPGQTITIRVNRLVMYTNEREAGAWQGHSMLRPAYKHWILKDRALRVMAALAERNGMGIPTFEAAPGTDQTQIDKYYTPLAQRLRTGQTAGMGIPSGSRMRLVGVEGTLPDVLAQVRYHDEQIAGNFLAQFMRLGVTDTGSRALGETFLDFFEAAVDALCGDFSWTFTAHAVEDLVDLNFSEDEPAPKLLSVPGAEEQVLSPEQVAELVKVQALTVDPALRQYLRDRFGLPELEPGEPLPTEVVVPPVQPAPVAAAAPAREQVRGSSSPWYRRAWKRVRGADRPAHAHRGLFSHEDDAAVDVDAVQEDWQEALAALILLLGPVKELWRRELVEQINGMTDMDELVNLRVSLGHAAALLEAGMDSMAQQAATRALSEAAAQGVAVAVPSLPAGSFTQRAVTVEQQLAENYAASARNRASTVASAGTWDGPRVAGEVDEHLQSLAGRYDEDYAGLALTDAQNAGREAVFAAGPPATYYASEALDKNTCPPCAQIDGTQFASLDEANSAYPSGTYVDCQGGPRCRGMLVAVYNQAAA